MKTFKVCVTWSHSDVIEVEAENEHEALNSEAVIEAEDVNAVYSGFEAFIVKE